MLVPGDQVEYGIKLSHYHDRLDEKLKGKLLLVVSKNRFDDKLKKTILNDLKQTKDRKRLLPSLSKESLGKVICEIISTISRFSIHRYSFFIIEMLKVTISSRFLFLDSIVV